MRMTRIRKDYFDYDYNNNDNFDNGDDDIMVTLQVTLFRLNSLATDRATYSGPLIVVTAL